MARERLQGIAAGRQRWNRPAGTGVFAWFPKEARPAPSGTPGAVSAA